MKIAKREDFALIFMSALAKYYSRGYISLSQVAKEENLSPLFLKHIAATLLAKGLVKSKEGISGGYRLRKAPQDISVSEIIGAISTGVISPSCAHGGTCRVKKASCSCLSFWDKVNKHFFSYLKNITLADFGKL